MSMLRRRKVASSVERFEQRRKVRRMLWNGIESLEARQMLASDWSNVLQPLNVKGDELQTVTPLDVLLVINEINFPKIRESNSSPLPLIGANGKSPPPYVDVDCDNFVTPLDVLIIINAINSKNFGPSWRFSQNGGGADAGSQLARLSVREGQGPQGARQEHLAL